MRRIEINKIFSSHNIIYRNLKKEDFLNKVISSFEKKHICFKKDGLNNQLVYVNILEGEHNPNSKPVEQYAIRDNSGKMIMNNLLIFEIFIPNLLLMMQKNNDLFMPEELVVNSFEIDKFHNTDGKPDIDESESVLNDDCNENKSASENQEEVDFTLTNSYINNSET